MTKAHLKRLAAPKEWHIERKKETFVLRPKGAISNAMPLGFILRDTLKYVDTMKEAKNVMKNKKVLVDQVERKDVRLSVGIMDTIDFPDLKTAFRMVLGKDKKLKLIKIADANLKICKIKNKKILKKGKIQLNLHDGSNVISEKPDYNVGDSLLITLPKREIKESVKLEKGVLIYLTGGAHSGSVGKVEGVDAQRVVVKLGDNVIETLKKFSMAVGKDKPLCTVVENE